MAVSPFSGTVTATVSGKRLGGGAHGCAAAGQACQTPRCRSGRGHDVEASESRRTAPRPRRRCRPWNVRRAGPSRGPTRPGPLSRARTSTPVPVASSYVPTRILARHAVLDDVGGELGHHERHAPGRGLVESPWPGARATARRRASANWLASVTTTRSMLISIERSSRAFRRPGRTRCETRSRGAWLPPGQARGRPGGIVVGHRLARCRRCRAPGPRRSGEGPCVSRPGRSRRALAAPAVSRRVLRASSLAAVTILGLVNDAEPDLDGEGPHALAHAHDVMPERMGRVSVFETVTALPRRRPLPKAGLDQHPGPSTLSAV